MQTSDTKLLHRGYPLLFLLFGLVLLAGAYLAFAKKQWPLFLAIQFDGIETIAEWLFGKGAALYFTSVLLLILGCGFVSIGLVVLRKQNTTSI